jgi:hypothetical protein
MTFNLVLGIPHNILLYSRSRSPPIPLRIQDILPTAACLQSSHLCVSNHVHDRTRAIRCSTPASGSRPGRPCPLEHGSYAKFSYGLLIEDSQAGGQVQRMTQ